jgi:hypothetical protein
MSRDIAFKKEHTLASLQTALRSFEGGYGSLFGIGNNGTKTIGQFDSTKPSPGGLMLATVVAGTAILPQGSTEICSGEVFIGGSLQGVVAFRP